MKHSILLILSLCVGVLLLVPAATRAEGGGPSGDAPSPTPGSENSSSVTVLQDGDVHQYPTTDAPMIGTVRSGDVVRVNEYIGAWARIAVEERALGGPVIPLADGWIDAILLDGASTPTPGTTPAPDGTPVPAWPTYERTPTPGTGPSDGSAPDAPAPTQIVTPSAAPTGSAEPTVRVSALPSDIGNIMPAQPMLPVSFSVPICYDRNANKFCDIDGEGVAGLSVYTTDSGGQLLGRALTDASGIAQFTIRAPATATLSVSVPYLGSNQSFPASNPRPVPVRLDARALLPALLPTP
jgi:hypothetical protein